MQKAKILTFSFFITAARAQLYVRNRNVCNRYVCNRNACNRNACNRYVRDCNVRIMYANKLLANIYKNL